MSDDILNGIAGGLEVEFVLLQEDWKWAAEVVRNHAGHYAYGLVEQIGSFLHGQNADPPSSAYRSNLRFGPI